MSESEQYFGLKPGVDMHPLPTMQPQLDETSRRLYDEVRPGVVQIFGSNTQERGAGSGFFIDDKGDVATAWHVVSKMNQVDVVTADGTVLPAKIKTIDDVDDVAILTVGDKTPQGATPLQLSPSDNLKPDDPEWAVGHPQGDKHLYISPGYFQQTQSFADVLNAEGQGAIQGANQKLESMTPDERRQAKHALTEQLEEGLIHVEPGNSGGPIINKDGQVVGLADMTALGSNETDVVPISYLKSLMNETTPKYTFSYADVPSELLKKPLAQDHEFILTDVSRTDGSYLAPYNDPFLGGDADKIPKDHTPPHVHSK